MNFISPEHTFFHVDAGAVYERCALLKNHQAGKEESELKQSGISPQDTLLDEAIEVYLIECKSVRNSRKTRTMEIFKRISSSRRNEIESSGKFGRD